MCLYYFLEALYIIWSLMYPLMVNSTTKRKRITIQQSNEYLINIVEEIMAEHTVMRFPLKTMRMVFAVDWHV